MSIGPSAASFALSAFGDEIVVDFESQLQCLRELNIGWLDLRTAWGAEVLHLADEAVAACTTYAIDTASRSPASAARQERIGSCGRHDA